MGFSVVVGPVYFGVEGVVTLGVVGPGVGLVTDPPLAHASLIPHVYLQLVLAKLLLHRFLKYLQLVDLSQQVVDLTQPPQVLAQ